MGRSLEISVELARPVARLSLVGHLDADTIGSVLHCLANIDPEFGTVVLDLAGLEALEPCAIHSLVAFHDELELRFQRLECQNASGDPARMLQMAGVPGSLELE